MDERDELALEFIKEYKSMCERYGMKIVQFDMWDSGHSDLVVYDKEEKSVVLDTIDML